MIFETSAHLKECWLQHENLPHYETCKLMPLCKKCWKARFSLSYHNSTVMVIINNIWCKQVDMNMSEPYSKHQ